MERVAVVVGTRPEAIKLAPVIVRFRRQEHLECEVWTTGQHRHMLDQALREFEIRPDVELSLMREGQSLAELTSSCIRELDRCMAASKPDLVVTQGDTTTVLCCALAAFYQRIPVAHVEAGLRTWDIGAPWPEEANRVITSRLATLHFAPTSQARLNLLREGVSAERVIVSGNTVVDALMMALERISEGRADLTPLPALLRERLSRRPESTVVLITGHRRESFGEGMEHICQAISELARTFPDVDFVYPVHLNPNVRAPVTRILGTGGRSEGGLHGYLSNIHLIEPLSYLPFVWLMARSTLILTDSGGIQEEAPTLGKTVFVLRRVTERPEAVAAGGARLVGNSRRSIVREVADFLANPAVRRTDGPRNNPYGDGRASERVVNECMKYLGWPDRTTKSDQDAGSLSLRT